MRNTQVESDVDVQTAKCNVPHLDEWLSAEVLRGQTYQNHCIENWIRHKAL